MNKTAIKNFAVWARRKLIADITYKAGLIGVSENGIAQPLPQSTNDLQFFDIGTKDYTRVAGSAIVQRNALVRAIQEKESTSDYETAFKTVIEEVAYTWFNRLIAIRFMEVNGYLPSRIRVLSSENPAKNEPDFVTTPFDTDMEFTMAEQDRIMELKDENKLNELFRMLFIKQCNKLHEILPELFEKTNDYTELLLSISFTDNDGIVYHLIHDIPEDDFNVEKEGQVEIIGWMYQFYNIEAKADVFSKKGKIGKEEVPAATQLFTPDWIVRYMVENSLGRLWVEGHPGDSLKENWKYYLEEAEQEASVQAQLEQIRAEYRNLNPEDIKVIDPCMGSGHILVYCFDVLMQIYESQGYTQRDAAKSILENNLFGLDIDKRAAQLAYFAVMMKARQYDRRIFNREIKPHVYAIKESNVINRGQLKYFGADFSPLERNKAKLQITSLLDTMVDARTYGSILKVENCDWNLLKSFVSSVDDAGQMTLDTIGIDNTQKQLFSIVEIAKIMAVKYDVVITNPPYMSVSAADAKLGDYVKKYYPDSKTDMFAVFIERCKTMLASNRFQAMITMHSWMFLSSYEKLREKLQAANTVSMAHLGARAFEEIGGEVVQTTAFVLRNTRVAKYTGCYCKLVEPTSQSTKEELFLSGDERYFANQENFRKIPGIPCAYWLSDAVSHVFDISEPAGKFAEYKHGMSTGKNDAVVRLWFEVEYDRIAFGAKNHEEFYSTGKRFVPYNKGGEYRKWYGNQAFILGYDLEYDRLMDTFTGHRHDNKDTYFIPNIAWSKVTSSGLAMRYFPAGFVYDVAGCSAFASPRYLKYLLAFYNLKIKDIVVSALSPTLNFEVGQLRNSPIIFREDRRTEIEELVDQCIAIAKADWDSFELSWDFERHPLVGNFSTVEEAFENWKAVCESRINLVREAETKLNQIFIEIYGLQNEVSPEVSKEEITLNVANLQREIKRLISYAVGCMFGRYSLDEKGIIYAGGIWSADSYKTFVPDRDNCIPITDEEYFEDDVVGQFCAWVKQVYGDDTLETNLEFIAQVLGNKGATAREVIRNYFLNDFYKEHCTDCSMSGSGKRPIYWLIDSGKQNGFKALVYMHRWNADTVGNVRVEYLHKMQHIYEREIQRMQEIIDNSNNAKEIAKANKRKEKLQKQLKEAQDYDAKLAHIALSRIDIDLDDGVKVNYEKVQTGRDGKKMQILAKL